MRLVQKLGQVRGENKISVRAGFWGGLVLFVIYVLRQAQFFRMPDISEVESFHLNLAGVGVGTVVGFLLLLAVRKVIHRRAASFIVLLLTFSGTAGLYTYLFIRTFNDILLSSTLGIALGTLLHVMLIPQSIREIFASS
jgi:hypothetical protein